MGRVKVRDAVAGQNPRRARTKCQLSKEPCSAAGGGAGALRLRRTQRVGGGRGSVGLRACALGVVPEGASVVASRYHGKVSWALGFRWHD